MKISLLLLLVLVPRAFAFHGGQEGNGGDPNEIKFKSVALNIRQWIESGNADSLKLPTGLSLVDYKSRMLAVLENYSIEFTQDQVEVAGGEKTCKNFVSTEGKNTILCNSGSFENFYSRDMNDIYRIVHHEFAGLAGLEVSQGQDSNYAISSQLSAFLQLEIVERLPILPKEDASKRWLPATGWRSVKAPGQDRPTITPFLLDEANEISEVPAGTQNPFASTVSLTEKAVIASVNSGVNRKVDVSSNREVSVQMQGPSLTLELTADRIPFLIPEPQYSYHCSLVETGETISIPTGVSAVGFDSQMKVALAAGKLVITAMDDAIYLSQYSVEKSQLIRTVVKVVRGNNTTTIKFTASGTNPSLSVACQMDDTL